MQGVGQAHSERGERGQARTDGRVSDISKRSLDLTLEAGAMQRSNRPISFGKKRREVACAVPTVGGAGCEGIVNEPHRNNEVRPRSGTRGKEDRHFKGYRDRNKVWEGLQ